MRALLISSRPDAWISLAFRETLALTGKKLVAPPLGLITAAALVPKDWVLRLVDFGILPRHRVPFWTRLVGVLRQNPIHLWRYIRFGATGLDMFAMRSQILERFGAYRASEGAAGLPPAGAPVSADSESVDECRGGAQL